MIGSHDITTTNLRRTSLGDLNWGQASFGWNNDRVQSDTTQVPYQIMTPVYGAISYH